MTRIRAVIGRYRFGRLAAVAVVLYLVAAAGAVALKVVSGERWPLLWVSGAVLTPRLPTAQWLVPALIVLCVFKAWTWWMVLRGPALPRAEGLPPDVVWARRLLYASVVWDLFALDLLEDIFDDVAVVEFALGVVDPLVWVVTVILLMRVVSGVWAWFRMLAVVFGLIGALVSLPVVVPGVTDSPLIRLLGWATCVSMLMVLIAQWRDGRWSGTTINFGRVAVIAPLLFPLLRIALQDHWLFAAGEVLVLSMYRMCFPVWLARTAHELAAPTGQATESETSPDEGRPLPPSAAQPDPYGEHA